MNSSGFGQKFFLASILLVSIQKIHAQLRTPKNAPPAPAGGLRNSKNPQPSNFKLKSFQTTQPKSKVTPKTNPKEPLKAKPEVPAFESPNLSPIPSAAEISATADLYDSSKSPEAAEIKKEAEQVLSRVQERIKNKVAPDKALHDSEAIRLNSLFIYPHPEKKIPENDEIPAASLERTIAGDKIPDQATSFRVVKSATHIPFDLGPEEINGTKSPMRALVEAVDQRMVEIRKRDLTSIRSPEDLKRRFAPLIPLFSSDENTPEPLRNLMASATLSLIGKAEKPNEFPIKTRITTYGKNSKNPSYAFKETSVNIAEIRLCENEENVFRSRDGGPAVKSGKWSKRPPDKESMRNISKAFNELKDPSVKKLMLLSVYGCLLFKEGGGFWTNPRVKNSPELWKGLDNEVGPIQWNSSDSGGNFQDMVDSWNKIIQSPKTNRGLESFTVSTRPRSETPKGQIHFQGTLKEESRGFVAYAGLGKILTVLACQKENNWNLTEKDSQGQNVMCVSPFNSCFNHFGSLMHTSQGFTRCMKDFVVKNDVASPPQFQSDLFYKLLNNAMPNEKVLQAFDPLGAVNYVPEQNLENGEPPKRPAPIQNPSSHEAALEEDYI